MRPIILDSTIFIETAAGIGPGQPLAKRAFSQIFRETPDAQAIWILKPGDREPTRITWQSGFFGCAWNEKRGFWAPPKNFTWGEQTRPQTRRR